MSFVRTVPGRGRKGAPLRIAVVEDHPDFRHAICASLRASERYAVLPPCDDLPAGRALLTQCCPDILLVDLGLPTGPGVTLLQMARVRWGRRCTGAVLSVTGTENKLLSAVAAGAKGVLFKSDPPQDWLHAVDMLAQGQSPLHPGLAGAMLHLLEARDDASACVHADRELLLWVGAGYTLAEVARRTGQTEDDVGRRVRRLYDQFQQPIPELSPRELELMSLLNRGFTFKQCAEFMGVSESTIKTHASRAYEKLGASNLQMALYEARLAGLLC
jgi:DNA-binding NarL/FixJ family response regulator